MRIIRKGTAVGDLEIGKGQKYDLTEVSAEGITKQQIDGDRKKLNAIFNVFDTQFNGVLDSRELANMVSVFNAIDKDRNNKLDKDELNALANILNERIPEGEEKVSGKDVKNFLLQILGAQKDDKKISVSELNTNKFEAPEIDINKDVQNIISGRIMGSDIKGLDPGQSDETVKKKQQEEEPQLHSYTVQEGERYTDLIISSLKAQDVTDPTDEQIKEAKDNFEKNNPGAVKRTAKGYEYLLVGAKVQLEGELQDENNAQEQINKYIREHVNNNGSGAVVKKPAADPAAAAAAKKEGYRPTFSPDYFYNEETKTHYKWNKAKNKFEEAPNLLYVDKDGSYTTKGISIADNHYKGVTFNQKGEIIRLDVRNDSNNRYANKDYAAEKLGFRETNASGSFGIYYDEKTQQHYKWNAEKYGFEPMDKNITWVGEENGNLILKEKDSSGKVIKETKFDNDNKAVSFTYYDNDKVKTMEIYDSNGIKTSAHEFNYDNHGNKTRETIISYDSSDGHYLNTFIHTYGKNDSYISQKVDQNGNPIGEPDYYNNSHQQINRTQYDALQK